MIKREITETVYEYDGEGKLISKRITETKEEEDGNSPSWAITTTTTDPAIIHPHIPYKPTFDTNDDSICHNPIITCCHKQD